MGEQDGDKESAALLSGREATGTMQDPHLCGTPSQQRRFVQLCALMLAVCMGLVVRRAGVLQATAELDAFLDPDAWSVSLSGCEALRCEVSVRTSAAIPAGGSFVVGYWPAGEEEAAVFSREHRVKGSTTTAALFRLRGSASYAGRVVLRAEGAGKVTIVSEFDFRTAATGCDAFDSAPLATVDGDPSFAVLMFPYADLDDGFRGLVAVDSSGWVVWYWNRSTTDASGQLEAFSQFRDTHVTQQYAFNDASSDTVGVVDASGTIGSVLVPENLENYTKNGVVMEEFKFMGHEARALRDGNVITTGYALSDMAMKLENETISYLAEEFFVVWDPWTLAQPNVQHLLWASDYVSLEDAVDVLKKQGESDNTEVIMEIYPLDDALLQEFYLMYFHISSVSVSDDDALYVVTLRNLHTVLAINRTSLELVWQFSSVLDRNDFAFASEADKFWNPHDAQLTTVNGTQRLCLMDDGYYHNKCQEEVLHVDYYCYSRGVCYVLDEQAATSATAFEFSYPNRGVLTLEQQHEDIFNMNGGSVEPIPDSQHMLTAFTSVYKNQWTNQSYAFETDATGQVIKSTALLPHVSSWSANNGATSGLYRVLPLKAINGEGALDPKRWHASESN